MTHGILFLATVALMIAKLAGWIFKTEDEAREALPSIATEAGAKYEQ